VELTAAFTHELRHFGAMDEVFSARGPQDHGDVSVLRQVFEQGSDRRDAHAGADQDDAPAATGVSREDAVGPSTQTRVPA